MPIGREQGKWIPSVLSYMKEWEMQRVCKGIGFLMDIKPRENMRGIGQWNLNDKMIILIIITFPTLFLIKKPEYYKIKHIIPKTINNILE